MKKKFSTKKCDSAIPKSFQIRPNVSADKNDLNADFFLAER